MSDKPRLLQRLVRRCLGALASRNGFILLPAAEIERLKTDAHLFYGHQDKLRKSGDRGWDAVKDIGYFQGLGDYSSRMADRYVTLYQPNLRAEGRGSKPLTNTTDEQTK